MVDTEDKKVERILHCLNPQLSLQCQHAIGKSFDEVCDIILRTERKAGEVQADQRRRPIVTLPTRGGGHPGHRYTPYTAPRRPYVHQAPAPAVAPHYYQRTTANRSYAEGQWP